MGLLATILTDLLITLELAIASPVDLMNLRKFVRERKLRKQIMNQCFYFKRSRKQLSQLQSLTKAKSESHIEVCPVEGWKKIKNRTLLSYLSPFFSSLNSLYFVLFNCTITHFMVYSL
eukprot:TRINITY_DN801_c0_g1_i8.p1 TRINITY_DN801_c0_g1~~TRINITY_DN801_c0_g1_i8.p1  ORF type:complete len:118 (+),score=9.26 TRINITY_DN801_c0_g1_i8:96-449(+)